MGLGFGGGTPRRCSRNIWTWSAIIQRKGVNDNVHYSNSPASEYDILID